MSGDLLWLVPGEYVNTIARGRVRKLDGYWWCSTHEAVGSDSTDVCSASWATSRSSGDLCVGHLVYVGVETSTPNAHSRRPRPEGSL